MFDRHPQSTTPPETIRYALTGGTEYAAWVGPTGDYVLVIE
jgi:hypothetical protein